MNIRVRMRVLLQDVEPAVERRPRTDGPLFHRWLPHGEEDAVQLSPQLRVWFERRGSTWFGDLVFPDPAAEELPLEAIARQSPVHGGPLIAEVRLEVDADEHASMMREGESYEAVARRVYRESYKPIRSFVDVLRTVYGQFWLQGPPPADNVGAFFNTTVRAKWAAEGDTEWRRFRPTNLAGSLTMVMTSPEAKAKLLKESDWRDLQRDATAGTYKPPAAAEALARACRLLDADDLRAAAVECVSALEIALDAFVDTKAKSDPVFEKAYTSLKQRPPLDGVLAISAPYTGATPGDVTSTLRVIEARNRIVHEGWTPTGQGPTRALKNELWACCSTISALLPPPRMRILRLGTGYSHYPPEKPDPT